MAVYTAVSEQQMQQLCLQFQLGQYHSHTPISEGMENSNYLLTTNLDKNTATYIVTLFEELSLNELPAYIALLNHYAELGLSVNAPIANRQGEYFIAFADKPVMICHKLAGTHIEATNLLQCAAMGKALAQLHTANSNEIFKQPPLQNFKGIRDNTWLVNLFSRSEQLLSNHDQRVVANVLCQYLAFGKLGLPQGIIHADLFRDNALFVNDELTGLLDFYSASQGYYLFDLAVTINDWCVINGQHSKAHRQALIAAYEMIRPLSADEENSLDVFLLVAALRFWLSRIIASHKKQAHAKKPIGVDKNAEAMRELFYQLLANASK